MWRGSREYLLTSILAVLAVILALALAVEWTLLARAGDTEAGLSTAKAPVQEDTAADGEEFELPGLESYAEMADHPLFMESRLPGAESAESAAPPPPQTPMSLKLMGVVRTPGGVTALVMDAKGKYKRLKPNDPAFDGWTLVEVGQDQVTMQQGERRELLRLLKPRKAISGIPPVPGQPAPGQGLPGRPQPGPAIPGQIPPEKWTGPGQMPAVPPPNTVTDDLDQDLSDDEEADTDQDTDSDTDENP